MSQVEDVAQQLFFLTLSSVKPHEGFPLRSWLLWSHSPRGREVDVQGVQVLDEYEQLHIIK